MPPSAQAELVHAPRTVVHLVHGTWPSGGYLHHRYPRLFPPLPTWFGDGSAFRQDIEARVPEIEWKPFRWSGENSEGERRDAALAFAANLRQELSKPDEACHLVVAHSHGGNVALWGLGDLSGVEQRRIGGLATLATPFLHFVPRTVGGLEGLYLRLFHALAFFYLLPVLLCLPGVALLVWAAGMTLDAAWDAMAYVGGPAVFVFLFVFGIRAWRAARRLQGGLPAVPRSMSVILALRAPADEASRAITVADAAARVSGAAWHLARSFLSLFRWRGPDARRVAFRRWRQVLFWSWGLWLVVAAIKAATQPVLPSPAELVILAMVGPVVGFALVLCLVLPFFLLLPLLAVPAQGALALAFGWDTVGLALMTEIAAEAGPPGIRVTLEILPAVADRPGMRHSIHEAPEARQRLADWIRERQAAWVAERGPRVLQSSPPPAA